MLDNWFADPINFWTASSLSIMDEVASHTTTDGRATKNGSLLCRWCQSADFYKMDRKETSERDGAQRREKEEAPQS